MGQAAEASGAGERAASGARSLVGGCERGPHGMGQGCSAPASCSITGVWLLVLPVVFKFQDKLEIQIFT